LRMAMPSAPLWLDMATLPGGGKTGAKVASRLTARSVLSMPMQLGPTIRIPALRTASSSSRSITVPSSPVSENPAEMTTRVLTPLSAHSPTTETTNLAGITTMARSTGSGMSSTDL